MSKLHWVADSPFSRIIKWLLCQRQMAHDDVLYAWNDLASDRFSRKLNPKGQVPVLEFAGEALADSGLIVLRVFAGQGWIASRDALLYRTAECDLAAVMQRLYAASKLEKGGQVSQEPLRVLARKDFARALESLLGVKNSPDASLGLGVTPGSVAVHVMMTFCFFLDDTLRGTYAEAVGNLVGDAERSEGFVGLQAALAALTGQTPAHVAEVPWSLF